MTATTEITLKTEPSSNEELSSSPQPVETRKAAVGFDTADQKLRVISADDILETTEKGELIDVDGRMLTILEFCDSIESARASCEEHANGVSETLSNKHIGKRGEMRDEMVILIHCR